MEILYTCPTCGITETIKQRPDQDPEAFLQKIPISVPCSTIDCEDRLKQRVKMDLDWAVVDLQGKELGRLILTQEIVQILDTTGVDLQMRFNSKTPSVTAWLE